MKIQKQLRPYVYTLVGVVVAIVGGISLRQCTKKTQTEAFDSVKYVEITPAVQQKLLRRVNAIGKMTANQSIVVRTELQGRIEKIHFQDGQAVKKGDALVEFDSAQAKLEAASAKARASQTEQMYLRSKELYGKELVSAAEFEKVKAEYEMAKAQAEEKALIVSKMVIKAPFEGIVGIREKDINVGAVVHQNVDIVSLVDEDPMMVDFSVSGAYVGNVKAGQDILLSVDGTDIVNQVAKVVAIDAKLDDVGNTIKVRGEASNAKGVLKPGMFAKAKIVIGEVPNAVMVPEAAVERSGNQHYVYKIDQIQDGVGRFSFNPVVIGMREAGLVEVVSGLTGKENVVIGGHTNLANLPEGHPVRVKVVDTSELKKKIAEEQLAAPQE